MGCWSSDILKENTLCSVSCMCSYCIQSLFILRIASCTCEVDEMDGAFSYSALRHVHVMLNMTKWVPGESRSCRSLLCIAAHFGLKTSHFDSSAFGRTLVMPNEADTRWNLFEWTFACWNGHTVSHDKILRGLKRAVIREGLRSCRFIVKQVFTKLWDADLHWSCGDTGHTVIVFFQGNTHSNLNSITF